VAFGSLRYRELDRRSRGEPKDVGKSSVMLGVTLVVVLTLGALVRCGGSGENGETPSQVPANPEDAGEMEVRVSGTEGIAYAGTYGNLEQEGVPPTIEDTLGDEPTEYEVEIEEGVSDGVSAFFEKTEPGSGELEAEILADGEVIAESTTYAEFGSVIVEWVPQTEMLEEIPIEEDSPEESP
jgi:hypothetical protein